MALRPQLAEKLLQHISDAASTVVQRCARDPRVIAPSSIAIIGDVRYVHGQPRDPSIRKVHRHL